MTLFDVYVKLLIDTVADIYFCRGAQQDTCDTLGDVQAVALIDTLADTLSEVQRKNLLILGNVKAKAVMHSLPDLNAYTNLETLHVLQA